VRFVRARSDYIVAEGNTQAPGKRSEDIAMTMQDSYYQTVTSQNRRILLVDDEQPIRKLLADILSPRGFTVTQCCNGKDAVKYYYHHSTDIDLVVMDVMMPEMNGFEALAYMQMIDPNVKAVMISGGTYTDDDIQRTGATAFASKPFQISKLLELLKQHTAGKSSPCTSPCVPA
jgi:CheY-like chemotaxis protein